MSAAGSHVREAAGSVAQPAYPAPRAAWYAIAVLLILYVNSFLDRTVIALIVEPIKADLQVSDTAISFLQGLAFAVFYCFLGIPIGRLADRASRRGIIAVGATFWALMATSCGLAQNYLQLFLARVGVGVGEASLTPSAYSLISDFFPREKLNRAYAVFMLGGPVGGALAFVIGGAVVGFAEEVGSITVPFFGEIRSWQLVFLITGLPGVLLAALMLTVREPARQGVLSGLSARAGGQPSVREVAAYLWQRRRVYGCLLGGFSLSAMLATGFLSWIAVFFMRTYGWSAAQAGGIFGGVALIGGVSGILSGSLWCDRLARRGIKDAQVRTATLSAALTLPVAIATPLAPTGSLAVALAGLLVFLMTFPQGTNVAAFQLITPNQLRAQVSALFVFSINICGLGVGATLVAVLTDYVFGNPAAVRYSLALAAVIAGVPALVLLLAARRPFRDSLAEAESLMQTGTGAGSGART